MLHLLNTALGSLPSLLAQTEADTLRGIGQGFDNTVDPGKVWGVLLAFLGLLVLLVLLGMRNQRQAIPKPVNNHGKLMRDVMRSTGMTPAETRQLRVLAEHLRTPDGENPSPLTLLLCPSLMSRSMSAQPDRADRQVLGQLVRRMQE
jgi:hypothetical protein